MAKSLGVVRSLSGWDEVLHKVLVATVSTGKAVFAHTVDVKSPGEDRYAAQRVVEYVCWLAIHKLLEESLKPLGAGG